MAIKHLYISEKGENFLNFDEYLRKNLSNEEWDDFHKLPQDDPRYLEFYKNWIIAEQITKHKLLEDGVEVLENTVFY